ncbi:Gfo/Idh/MocA family protein [Subtercola frigoramans]|uniref:Dehydrogenase n=1 Tax=Subtercola frigoramans TaxID=120298 RepID=A0ABS2L7S0_9MICO|nr:Gfo/Idh/MocA family oxidoreductase [Subtercola frigoramans]MBM7473114.1 putative dehydrogenase [Subtercola frigoramans]
MTESQQSSGPVRIGVIGAGSVSDMYLSSLSAYPDVDVQIVTDRHPDRAAAQAGKYGIARHGVPEEALDDPDIEVILNLTPPAAHTAVSLAAISRSKHVYSEKPLSADVDGGRAILAAAAANSVVIGSAPDITLGSEFQSALRLVADGGIGDIVFARCEAVLAGPEIWHPRPQFLYAPGGGPLFDIGPYYLTALVAALGPITDVVGRGTRKSLERTIGSGPLSGQTFPVEVPSLTTAILGFASGITAQLLLTFDSASHRGGQMEIFGTTATLRTPDPNGVSLASALLDAGSTQWQEFPIGDVPVVIGPGVVNFARHLRGVEPLVVDGRRALHVLDVMAAIATSSHDEGRVVTIESTFPPSPVLPAGWSPTEARL